MTPRLRKFALTGMTRYGQRKQRKQRMQREQEKQQEQRPVLVP